MACCSPLPRWIVFNAVGAVGAVVQLGVLAGLDRIWHLHYLCATGMAVEAAILHNFIWHQRWTWHDRPATSIHDQAIRLARFHLLNGGISLTGNLALMAFFTGTLHLDPLAANLVAIVSCAVANFAASDALVFSPARRDPDSLFGRPMSVKYHARFLRR
jgi:putative flippase GtrA